MSVRPRWVGARFVSMACVALCACAPPADEESWRNVRSVCGLDGDAHFELAVAAPQDDGSVHGLVLPDGCPDALLAAVHADTPRLMRQSQVSESLDEHVEGVRRGLEDPTGVAMLTWAVAWLVGGDFGRVSELEVGPFSDPIWRDDFQDAARARGLEDASPASLVAFLEVASAVKGVRLLPRKAPADAGMGIVPGTGLLSVRDSFTLSGEWYYEVLSPLSLVDGLFHEAVHTRGHLYRHVDCVPPALVVGRYCDADRTKAYGAGLALAWSSVATAVRAGCDTGSAVDEVARLETARQRGLSGQTLIAPIPAGVASSPCGGESAGG